MINIFFTVIKRKKCQVGSECLGVLRYFPHFKFLALALFPGQSPKRNTPETVVYWTVTSHQRRGIFIWLVSEEEVCFRVL